MSTSTTSPDVGAFERTQWSVVMKAAQKDSPGAAEALAELCRTYWYPLYSFIRRRGHNHEDAEDLTQGFFTRLLEKEFLDGITVEGGKFRSYLLTLLKRFLANERERECAKKRGGGQALVSIDAHADETRYACEPVDTSTPETLYERRWAMTLLDRVRNRLRGDYTASGNGELFARLHSHLTGAEDLIPYAELGARLGMSEGAVKAAMVKLKGRYRSLLLEEVAATVSDDPGEIEEEIRHLRSVASRGLGTAD